MKEKSNTNEEAALLLKDNGQLCSSIHCSYYSIVQTLIHLLLHHYDLTNEEIKERHFSQNKGIHWYLKKFFSEEIDIVSRLKGRDFRSFLGQLNALRVKSDYHDLPITIDETQSAIELTNNIKVIISTTYTN